MMTKDELLYCAGLERGLLEGIPSGSVLVLLDGRRRFLASPGECPIRRFEFEIKLAGMVDGLDRPYGQPLGPAIADDAN